MKIVYVAGPYRAKTEWQILQNIRMAETVALAVWYHGGAAICPHKNTAWFGGANGINDDVWLKGDLEIIKRCDALIVCPNSEYSEGTQAEIKLAKELKLPIYYWDNDDAGSFHGATWELFIKFLKN